MNVDGYREVSKMEPKMKEAVFVVFVNFMVIFLVHAALAMKERGML